jgi:hypothetical protein
VDVGVKKMSYALCQWILNRALRNFHCHAPRTDLRWKKRLHGELLLLQIATIPINGENLLQRKKRIGNVQIWL